LVTKGQNSRVAGRAAVLGVLLVLCLAMGCARRLPEGLLPGVPDAEAVGIFHEVKAGETLFGICKLYGADLQEVAEINDLTDARALQVGQRLFVPDVSGPKPTDDGRTPGSADPNPGKQETIQQWQGEFIWPVTGVVTSSFGVRGGRRHDGIDIGAPASAEVRAAAAGTVLFSGEQGGYGNLLILKHDAGLITIYAHNQANLVKEGQEVKQGQAIARVGQTGRATGPHVHFEIRSGKQPRNPLFFLPRPS
jgi:murein DD-endopeptidase MepM/ murein hydrolase activator NlpD